MYAGEGLWYATPPLEKLYCEAKGTSKPPAKVLVKIRSRAAARICSLLMVEGGAGSGQSSLRQSARASACM